MPFGRERLVESSGPLIAVAASRASADEWARALGRWQASSVLVRVAREARLGNTVSLVSLLRVLPLNLSSLELERVPLDWRIQQLERALEGGQLLLVPGWELARGAPLSAARSEGATEREVRPAARAPVAGVHELSIEYMTNTGHFVIDEHGFELRHPSGTVERGKLSNGRLQRKGVAPGSYEFRARGLRGARWSTTSATPFEAVTLIVSTRGFPDGTRVELGIRSVHTQAVALSIEAEIKSDRAVASWAYEQAVGARGADDFQFEAKVGKKRARSDVLSVAPHPASTPRGAQERLRQRGYDPGAPADDVTPALRAALEQFQTEHPPLVAQGELDPFTVDALDDPFI